MRGAGFWAAEGHGLVCYGVGEEGGMSRVGCVFDKPLTHLLNCTYLHPALTPSSNPHAYT